MITGHFNQLIPVKPLMKILFDDQTFFLVRERSGNIHKKIIIKLTFVVDFINIFQV